MVGLELLVLRPFLFVLEDDVFEFMNGCQYILVIRLLVAVLVDIEAVSFALEVFVNIGAARINKRLVTDEALVGHLRLTLASQITAPTRLRRKLQKRSVGLSL